MSEGTRALATMVARRPPSGSGERGGDAVGAVVANQIERERRDVGGGDAVLRLFLHPLGQVGGLVPEGLVFRKLGLRGGRQAARAVGGGDIVLIIRRQPSALEEERREQRRRVRRAEPDANASVSCG